MGVLVLGGTSFAGRRVVEHALAEGHPTFNRGRTKAAAGLDCRPIEAVVADLAEWDRSRPQEPLRAGMTREREAELLRKFRVAPFPKGALPPAP